jgi:hypothetical protein
LTKYTESVARFLTDLVVISLRSRMTLPADRRRPIARFGSQERRTKRCTGAAKSSGLVIAESFVAAR